MYIYMPVNIGKVHPLNSVYMPVYACVSTCRRVRFTTSKKKGCLHYKYVCVS